jgi:hypothetical protein
MLKKNSRSETFLCILKSTPQDTPVANDNQTDDYEFQTACARNDEGAFPVIRLK